MGKPAGRNCIDVIAPLTAAYDARGVDNVQYFGGVGTFALQHPDVEIFPDERRVAIAGRHSVVLPQFRSDGNRRDFDALVISTDEADRIAAEEIAREVIGDELVLSFFGLRTVADLQAQLANPIRNSLKAFVSDRYAEQSADGEVISVKKALFPFAVSISPASLETWQLQIGNLPAMPIPHPGSTVINYLTRSISGLRPKDAAKVDELVANIAAKSPGIIEWIHDDPSGAAQIELARILHTLRESRTKPRSLQIGAAITIRPYNSAEIVEHPGFLLDDESRLVQAAVMRITTAKARVLHAAERQQKIVTYWQAHIEPRIERLLRNEA